MIRPLSIAALAALSACTSPDQSVLIYRLPYATNTDVRIWQDQTTHAGNEPAIDMAGVNGTAPYTVVAARAGTIRFIEDDNTENCPNGGCPNNYVWIQHQGLEWTKYSHLATGSVTGAGWTVGAPVAAGQFIGLEGNVGIASGSNMGRHVHFEVREVTPGSTPSPAVGDMPGPMRVPRFCGVPGQTVEQGQEYSVVPCPQ